MQEDTDSDSDVSMEDKAAKDDLDEKLDESMLEDSKDDKVKDDKKEQIVELPTSCPVCKKPCKQFFMHLNSNKHCKQSIHPDELEFLENIRENIKKLKNRERKARQRKHNPDAKLNPEDNKKAVAKWREKNPDEAKKQAKEGMARKRKKTVSYTHLTLPTILLV